MIPEAVRGFPKWVQQKITRRSESLDDKEKDRDDKAIEAGRKIHEAMNKFPKICEEYAKINSIELSPLSGYGTERLKDMYNLLNDAKFIDFALDKYGIAYNEKMFRVPPIPDYLHFRHICLHISNNYKL